MKFFKIFTFVLSVFVFISILTSCTGGHSTTVVVNHTPSQPKFVNPVNQDTNVSTCLTISWNSTDIDGDKLEYEIFIGTSADKLNKIGSTVESTNLKVKLNYNTVYYSKIFVTDNKEKSFSRNSTESNVITFTTMSTPVNPGSDSFKLVSEQLDQVYNGLETVDNDTLESSLTFIFNTIQEDKHIYTPQEFNTSMYNYNKANGWFGIKTKDVNKARVGFSNAIDISENESEVFMGLIFSVAMDFSLDYSEYLPKINNSVYHINSGIKYKIFNNIHYDYNIFMLYLPFIYATEGSITQFNEMPYRFTQTENFKVFEDFFTNEFPS